MYALAREVGTAYALPLRPLDDVFPAGGAATGAAVRAVRHRGRRSPACASSSRTPTCARGTRPPSPTSASRRRPAWLANRLEAAGVRPISNVVDVTNYVLIEIGHPMHAFDLSRLRRRRAADPPCPARASAITTLDGVERTLDADMLVIADAAEPQAIAGVMGGAGSEVWGGTRAIAFESAYFQPDLGAADEPADSASRPRRRRGSSAAPTSTRRRSPSSAPSR